MSTSLLASDCSWCCLGRPVCGWSVKEYGLFCMPNSPPNATSIFFCCLLLVCFSICFFCRWGTSYSYNETQKIVGFADIYFFLPKLTKLADGNSIINNVFLIDVLCVKISSLLTHIHNYIMLHTAVTLADRSLAQRRCSCAYTRSLLDCWPKS